MPVNFDGVDDELTAGTTADYDLTENFSVSYWFNMNGYATDGIFEAVGRHEGGFILNAGGAEDGWCCVQRTITGDLYHYLNVAGAGGRILVTYDTNAAPDSTWHHYCGVVDGETGYVYIDGVQVASNTASPAVGARTTTKTLVIGNDELGFSEFPGSLQDLRIYNYALTLAEIETLAKSRLGIGSPVQGATYTYECIDFDGTDDHIEIAATSDHDLTTTFTIMGWVRRHTKAASMYPIARRSDVANSWNIILNTVDSVMVVDGSGSIIDSGLDLTGLNEWNHIAIVFTSTTAFTGYVNAVAGSSQTYSAFPGTSPTQKVFIGARSGTSNPFDGELADWRIYSDVVTAAEIREIYEGGPGADTVSGNRVGWYKLDDLSSGVHLAGTGNIIDSGTGGHNGDGKDANTSQNQFAVSTVSPKQLVGYWPLSEHNTNAYEVDLDGTDDYLVLDGFDANAEGFNGDSNWSIAIWVKPDAALDEMWHSINGTFHIQFRTSQASIRGGSPLGNPSASWSVDTTGWQLLTLVYDTAANGGDGGFVVYKNGSTTLATSSAPTNPVTGSVGTTTTLFATDAGATSLLGSCSAVRAWTTKLTAAQMDTLYNEGKLNSFTSVDRTNLKLELNFNEVASVTDEVVAKNDNSNDYIDCGAGVGDATATFSISCWIKTSTTTNETILSRRDATNTQYDLRLASAVLRFYDGASSFDGSTDVGDGRWHHVVFAMGATNAVVYLDGAVEIASFAPSITSYSAIPFLIHTWLSSGTPQTPFDGFITDVQIWESTELNSGNVSSIYTNGRYGTAVASPTHRWYLTVPGQDYGVSIDGENQAHIGGGDMYDDAANQERTWSWWFRAESSPSTYMICKRGSDTGNPGYYGTLNSNNNLSFGLDAGTNGIAVTSESSVADTGWHHAGVIHKDDRLDLFLDGEWITGKGPVEDTNNVIPASHANNGPLVIGARRLGFSTPDSIFSGDLYDVRTWDYALEPVTMSGIYQSGRSMNQSSPTGEAHRWYLNDAVESDGDSVVFQDSVGDFNLTGSHVGSNSILGYKLDGIGEVWSNNVEGSGANVAIGKDTAKAGLTFSNAGSFDDYTFKDSSGNDNDAVGVDETLNSSQLRECGIGEVTFRDYSGNENHAVGSDADDSRSQITDDSNLVGT